MGESDFVTRIKDLYNGFKHSVRRFRWGFLVILLVDFLYELMKHRFFEAANRFLDDHVSFAWLKPALLGLQYGPFFRPLVLTLELFVLFISILLLHAYLETRSTRTRPSAVDLPCLRPFVNAIRYGKHEPTNKTGLIVTNEGEPAYNLSIQNVRLGASRLIFLACPSRLTKNEGEILIEAWIEQKPNVGLLGSGLRGEMVSNNLAAIPVAITYEDRDKLAYVTRDRIEREVSAPDGLIVRLVSQELKQSDPDAPVFALEAFDGELHNTADPNTVFRIRNCGKRVARNVRVSPLLSKAGKRQLLFDPISSLAPGEDRSLTLHAGDGDWLMKAYGGHLRDLFLDNPSGDNVNFYELTVSCMDHNKTIEEIHTLECKLPEVKIRIYPA